MIRSLYTEHFKNKFFNRILVTYSAIIVIFALGLSFVTSNNISMSIISKEKQYNEQVLNSVDSYLQQRLAISKNLVQQIYINHSLHTEVSYLMNSGFEKHLEYKLDKFASSKQSSYNGFEKIFKSTTSCYNDIVSIGLYSTRINKVFVYSNTLKVLNSEDFFIDAVQMDRKIIPCHITKYLPQTLKLNVFTITYPIMDRYSSNILGLLIIDFNVSSLNDILLSQKEFLGSAFIFSGDGKYVYSYGIESNVQSEHFFENYTGVDKRGIKRYKTYEDNEIIALVVTPEHIINKKNFLSTKVIYTISVLFIIGAIIFTYLTVKNFSEKFKTVLNGFRNVKNGNLSTRIPIKGKKDEISELSVSFNSMCDKLNQYIKEVYVSEIKQKNAQIDALQAQINPHFLYNTLEAIRMKSIVLGAEEVGEMIYLLSELFRSSIKGDTLITIEEEIQYSEMYMELFNLQYMDNVKVEIQAPKEVLNYSIIKHAIQPLIENCINHGLDLSKTDNEIIIKITKEENNYILVSVSDNGKGIKEEKFEEIKTLLRNSKNCLGQENKTITCQSMGLSNINDRIKLIYGDNYGIDINSIYGEGCEVLIKIPVQTKSK